MGVPDVHDSLPAVLFLAYKYAAPDQVRAALLANANVGGNTVHRGAILGGILGAAHGSRAGFGGGGLDTSMLLDGLHDGGAIAAEVEAFLDAALPRAGEEGARKAEAGAGGLARARAGAAKARARGEL
jgi:hypothetical protein